MRNSPFSKLILVCGFMGGMTALPVIPLASAVEVSASSDGFFALSNHMALPGPAGLFDPGLADFGLPGLAAPAAGASTVTVPFAYPGNAPNAANPVQMYGDAISTITNLGAGSFQLELTLTNFWMDQGSALPTNEYVYLNVWETFTNLGLPSNLSWATSGSISVNGLWSALPNQFVAIEPIAIVYDPSLTSWTNASTFFGANGTGPGSGPLIGSAPVSALTPYVSGGQLTVGMQAILLMNDPAGAGGASINLPTSLHLAVTLTPVPEPSSFMLAALAVTGCSIRRWRRSLFRRRSLTAWVALGGALLGLLGLTAPVQAAQHTLVSNNSSFKIDTLAQATAYEWKVDGVQHLRELSNWYRVGNSGPETSIHTLPSVDSPLGANLLSVIYTDPLGRFTIDMTYGVTGGALGSGYSEMGELVGITNTSSQPLDFHFFEYVDLDLSETAGDDTVQMTSASSLAQTDALTTFTTQYNGHRHELATYPLTLNKLTNAVASNLNSVWPAGVGPLGPDNVTWALQWDFLAIAPGDTVWLTKDCQLQMVPEPSTWILSGLGLVTLMWRGRGAFASRQRPGSTAKRAAGKCT